VPAHKRAAHASDTLAVSIFPPLAQPGGAAIGAAITVMTGTITGHTATAKKVLTCRSMADDSFNKFARRAA
jgi:hypothetical protein